MTTAAEDELALRALSTPSLEAPDALEVLTDVLLEAGILSDEQLLVSEELRTRAFQWAKRRHAPLPSPMQQLVAIVIDALDDLEQLDLPHSVVGVVGPFNVRIHFVDEVGPDTRVLVREAIARRLPVPVVIDVSSTFA